MLTGDENIIDVHCVVFWRIRNAQHYLFNIQNPEITVKDVAESAIRDIVGQSDIQPLLTGARQKTEQAIQKLMQDVLDSYSAGVSIDQVQFQKVDPPTQVIDAFRDVQAARADQQRLQNEAGSYANRIVPEARGEAERILQGARAYKEQTIAEAIGQTARFLNIYEEYKKAPEVTRKRMYLETMERVLGGTDKIILDTRSGKGPLPVLAATAANRDPALETKSMPSGSPVLIRIFKQESELELRMQKGGRFELFATYPVCFWSGNLGPKLREGDKQAPEGLYSVGVTQIHPEGRLPHSLDIGFPNSFDRAHARTGS